jgi:uncharacterized protein YdcH (DUF465 family)
MICPLEVIRKYAIRSSLGRGKTKNTSTEYLRKKRLNVSDEIYSRSVSSTLS